MLKKEIKKIVHIVGLFSTCICCELAASTSDQSVNELAYSETDFAFSLVRLIDEDQFVISPYSIYATLSMTYQGARGKTDQEMQKALYLTIDKKQLPFYFAQLNETLSFSNHEDSIAFLSFNALWLGVNSFILSDFRHSIQDDYQAYLQTIDFNSPDAALEINSWVKDKTLGKIPNLLQPGDLNALTQMILTNATYFKGGWLNTFDPKNTITAPFFTEHKDPLNVEMMHQKATFSYLETDKAQVIALPFKQKDFLSNRFACVLFLPKEDVKISSLHISLSSNSFQEQLSSLQPTYIDLKCPKFKLCYRLLLNQLLQKMGIALAFSPQADFSGINGLHNLFISQVFHEAIFDFDESGVTAAAATAAAISVTSIPYENPPIEFNANHPFLFFIVDLNLKIPLFMGQVLYPDGSESMLGPLHE